MTNKIRAHEDSESVSLTGIGIKLPSGSGVNAGIAKYLVESCCIGSVNSCTDLMSSFSLSNDKAHFEFATGNAKDTFMFPLECPSGKDRTI